MIKPSLLIYSILLSWSAGIIGSIFTFQSISTWYVLLNKPDFNPPNYLFGPVWSVLYTLMGISFYFIWRTPKTSLRNQAINIFLTQLFFNGLWSIVFFGFRDIFTALIVILILWVSILMTILRFWQLNKTAAYLLLPYLLWVSIATVLNFSIWKLNP